jgi:hypothetical protein
VPVLGEASDEGFIYLDDAHQLAEVFVGKASAHPIKDTESTYRAILGLVPARPADAHTGPDPSLDHPDGFRAAVVHRAATASVF